MVGKCSDDFDVLAMAQELKSAFDEFRKVVHEALDQRRGVCGQPGSGQAGFGQPGLGQAGCGQPGSGKQGSGKPMIDQKLPVRIRAPTWIMRESWFTSREACEYLRVTPRTLGRYRKKQLIPYRMIGGTCRYRYEELVALMEKKSSTNNTNLKTNQ